MSTFEEDQQSDEESTQELVEITFESELRKKLEKKNLLLIKENEDLRNLLAALEESYFQK